MTWRNRLSRVAAFGIVSLNLAGCATAVRGSSQFVAVSSEPGGAIVSVDGIEKDTTPAVMRLPRKSPHTIGLAMAGYTPQTHTIAASSDYMFLASNLLLLNPGFAAVGIGVDLLTGAHRGLSPAVINSPMTLSDSAAVARRTAPARWQPVRDGSRIRVWSNDASPAILGRLLSTAGDTLIIESDASLQRRISRGSIRSLELGLGVDRGGAVRRSLLKGLLTGIAAGAAVGAIAHGAEGAYYFAFLFGAPAGLVAGGIVGAAGPPSDRWVPMPAITTPVR